MNNPSQGLQAPLQNHVHLISGHRFPIIASLDLAQALIYLLDAPTIVKTIAPMSWTYVQAPPDGTLWLEWLPPTRMETQAFSSDGYIWADAESTFRHDYKGYTIEVLKHTMGYRMNYDQIASHARTRFHIVAKNPSVNAAPPDPALWIVHYHQADRILPASQAPFPPQMQQIMQERKWLESQGKLEKRDFMLHDRQSWPQITVPASNGRGQGGMQQQGMYGQPGPSHIQQGRGGQPAYYPQQVASGQPPAAKRQRPNPPVAGGSHDGVHDINIEEEENTTQGDFFDHLTTRDISMARYTQHHRWMEEVFSSPYASNQLVPADLGLGLMGELKGLTDGILEPPQITADVGSPRATKPTEAQPFTNLSQDQVAEFNRRVAKHLEEGKAEIERMKAEHEAKMSAWKKSGGVMKAEKRLRLATWEGHEGAVPTVFRVEGQGTVEGGEGETVQSLVQEVEGLLGMKIAPRKEYKVVEKGGLEREEEVPAVQDIGRQMLQQQQQQQYGGQQQSMTANSGGNQEPTMYHQDPSSSSEAMTTMQYGLQQGLEAQRRILAAQPLVGVPQQQLSKPAVGVPTAGAEVSNTPSMMAGMDVAGTSNIDFGASEVNAPATGTSTQQPPTKTSTEGMAQQLAVPDITLPPTAANDTDMILAADDDNAGEAEGMADDSLFNESMFGDLTNTGEGDGEGAGGDFDFAASSTAGGGLVGSGGMGGVGSGGEGEAFGEGMFGMSGAGGDGTEGQ
ncbi:hypothetical protein LTR10_007500 [Elasticomyces elasticus]|nr:hypothetical protein LTR10_007500 [Elasticomyces elasticus]KAK4979307.1 hypothetical protein LTR42_001810 [Elasticomyces elasticus]